MTELSIVIPTYQGPLRLLNALQSLGAQSAAQNSFEAVVVINGPSNGYEEVLETIRHEHPNLQLRTQHLTWANAGNARNVGVEVSTGTYVTFLDDDDWLQPEFIALALEHAHADHIVVLPLIDYLTETDEYQVSMYGKRTRNLLGTSGSLSNYPWALSFTACKIVPRLIATKHAFDPELRSGEDLVYFAGYLADDLTATFAFAENAHYVRALRPGSISRQDDSFDFRVAQRLACLQRLEELPYPDASPADEARRSLMRSQARPVAQWLEQQPEDRARVLEAAAAAGLSQSAVDLFNQGLAEDIAFLYAFAPDSDTSAVVAAKRLAQRGTIVDVISNDMSSVRGHDEHLATLSETVLDEHVQLSTPVSFESGSAVSQFAMEALLIAERKHRVKRYRGVYSRALWTASHVAAALFKLRHWPVRWTAEFSDPLRFGTQGGERRSAIADDVVTREMRGAIAARGFGDLHIPSTFALAEAVTMILADELLFTNTRQLQVMVERWGNPALTTLVQEKAVVSPHPQPPPAAYSVKTSAVELPEKTINIGYFGNFYPNRGLDKVLDALDAQPASIREAIQLHVFTNDIEKLSTTIAGRPSQHSVTMSEYLPYFEFLNLTTRLDVLLVTDTVVGDAMSVNPYLPSKVSDYSGSGKAIWALVDHNSPMSEMSFPFQAAASDVAAIGESIRSIVDHFQTKGR